jgi:hypothetical protein
MFKKVRSFNVSSKQATQQVALLSEIGLIGELHFAK